jgi:hypothetical protein
MRVHAGNQHRFWTLYPDGETQETKNGANQDNGHSIQHWTRTGRRHWMPIYSAGIGLLLRQLGSNVFAVVYLNPPSVAATVGSSAVGMQG